MNIWIVYDTERYQKNQVFADKLKDAFFQRNLEAKVVIIDDLLNIPFPLPDIAIMRVINPELSAFFTKHHVYIQNKEPVSRITNDKYKTYQYLEKIVPMAKTYLIDATMQSFLLPFPFILKSLDGHGGQEVFYVQNLKEVQNAFKQTQKKKMIIQEVIEDWGKDLRVYVLHDQILCAMLRTSKTSFKSNFSLGGNASLYVLNQKEKQLIKKIIKQFDFGLVGIDFLFKNNQLILNEIEDVVGCRMVYQYTNIDIAFQYVDYILKDYTFFKG